MNVNQCGLVLECVKILKMRWAPRLASECLQMWLAPGCVKTKNGVGARIKNRQMKGRPFSSFEKVVEWVKILTLERYCVFESVVFSVLYGSIGIRNATTDNSFAKNGGIFDPDGNNIARIRIRHRRG